MNRLSSKTRALLLNLTRSTLRGGVEVYAEQLRKILPALNVWGKEDVPKNGLLSLSFLQEPLVSRAFAHKLDALHVKPDFLFTSGLHGWAIDSNAQKIPTLSIMHGTYAGLAEAAYPRTSPLYWRMRHAYGFLEKKSAENAHVCVANSPFTQRELKKQYGVDSRVVFPPVDTRTFSPGPKSSARKKVGWDSKQKIVLFVGNPTYSKGWDVLIELAARHPEYHFHCVCSPTLPSPLSNVTIHSFVSHEELVHYYRAADALLFPSRYEGFGFVPLEALASGCPVISSEVGIFHDFSPPGWVKVSHALESFAHALKGVMENGVKGNAHAQIKKKFSFESFSRGYSDAFEEALACTR